MSYETVETGLATQIKALSAFDDDQVSQGNFLILGYGHPHAAVIEYNGFRAVRDSSDVDTLFVWTARINLYARYTDDDGANNALRDRRDEIVTRILQNPTLGATALDSMPVRGEREDEEVRIGNVVFLHEWIDVEIEERVNA